MRRLATEKIEEFNAYFESCPSRKLLERISNKWAVLIMSRLSERSMRYSELSKDIAGISEKMLTQTLRALERDGFVVRTVTPSVPPRTDYDLTESGRSLSVVITQLKSWAETHIDVIEIAQREYDRSQSNA
ncbi:helix-turn-helix transcriptional regulator [Flexivirga sp. ID2601S]|uniref:Helix-turn-helix transcriptional regulator n=1 Tax=Flexivirga aerilata TaxID=1656889 RepID=A0A849AGF0_9MICO|nr:helix-turn-helix domain-containing protein [Flexivirga aerilata]NNG38963.1 helix-turn-helix transcriptional regulator [Flexivirga aerilata]